MNRRTFLLAGAGTASVAGCLDRLRPRSGGESSDDGSASESEQGSTGVADQRPPIVDDRPDAVYHPTHTEGMVVAALETGDPYGVALSYTYPERFWIVTGREGERVSIRDDASIHLMLSVWDTETDTVLPAAGHSLTLTQEGEHVDERSLWPMLGQSMGHHFGDNVALPDEGIYTATVRLSPLDARGAGDFAGRFDEPTTVEIEFGFSEEARDNIAFDVFEKRRGERGAVEPMEMDVPLAGTPAKEDLPGETLGEATSGDGVFVATAIEDGSRFGISERTYLAVSPRTLHNGFPLPFMSLSATLTRDGSAVFDGPLRAALDPALEYHYGAGIEGVETGDALTLSVESPPQVARHEGYETAFRTMPKMELTV